MGRKSKSEEAVATLIAPGSTPEQIDGAADELLGGIANGSASDPEATINSAAPLPAVQKRVENKSERFARLARMRMPKLLKALRAMQRLGNRTQYDFTDRQAERILTDLREAVMGVQQAFAGNPILEAETWDF